MRDAVADRDGDAGVKNGDAVGRSLLTADKSSSVAGGPYVIVGLGDGRGGGLGRSCSVTTVNGRDWP